MKLPPPILNFQIFFKKYFTGIVIRNLGLQLLIFLHSFTSHAQEIELAEGAELFLITCTPDHRNVLTTFGHCAIRVYDRDNGINRVYHYGVLDFNSTEFLSAFIKQELHSNFEVSSYYNFKLNYTYFKRVIKEYPLNLTNLQRQKIFNFLVWNALPENREYIYHYFNNNCATKLRDVFVKNLEGEIQFDTVNEEVSSYKKILSPYLIESPWTELLFDLCLGLTSNQIIPTKEKMFLPHSLKAILETARVKHGNEFVNLLFCNDESTTEEKPSNNHNLNHPILLLGLVGLILVGISIRDFKRRQVSLWVDWIVYSLTGVVGILLLAGWLVFDHWAMAFNMNLLWALPTNLLVIVMPNRIKKGYFFLALLIVGFLLLGWVWLPQQLNYALIPIAIGLGLRYWVTLRLTM